MTAASVGANHDWNVVIAGQVSSNPVTSVFPPSLDALGASSGVDNATLNITLLRTSGGDWLTFSGTNFGPHMQFVQRVWGERSDAFGRMVVEASACVLAVKHVQLQCQSPPGVGRDFLWYAQVEVRRRVGARCVLGVAFTGCSVCRA